MWTIFNSLLHLLQYYFCFMFCFVLFFDPEACGILLSCPGIKPAPPALEDEVLTSGSPRMSQVVAFYHNHLCKGHAVYLVGGHLKIWQMCCCVSYWWSSWIVLGSGSTFKEYHLLFFCHIGNSLWIIIVSRKYLPWLYTFKTIFYFKFRKILCQTTLLPCVLFSSLVTEVILYPVKCVHA